jgi:hypothetical protein
MPSVWVYVDTSRQVGDAEHLKVFANQDAAEAWFRDNDPEGLAFDSRRRQALRPGHPSRGNDHPAAASSSRRRPLFASSVARGPSLSCCRPSAGVVLSNGGVSVFISAKRSPARAF